MNIKKMRILFLSCLAFLVLACSKDKLEGLSGGDETCGVSFALKADYTLNEVVLTRSASAPADEEFKVRIENTRAEILKEWEYGDLPSLIKVVPGSYKLVGWFGSDTLLPAFERPYYYGETKITLKDGDVLDTIVPVKVAATKVAVVFDESFTYDYDDYFVDIKTVGDSLRFLKEETREGYFLPGKLRMRFGLKPKGSDIYYQFYPDAIAHVKAKQFYKMTLKAQTKNGALSMISITTDSTTIDIPVEVDLPPFYLPKKAPVVTIAADDMEEGYVLTTEGLSKKAVTMITSAAGLTELKIRTVSDTLLNRGWPAEFDLMKATSEQKALLRANGLDWSEAIDGQDTIKTTVWVNFNNVVKLLNTAPGLTASSLFEIHVKDRFNQAGNECKFGIKVAPPVFEFVGSPGEGNIWAKKTLYNIRYISEVRTPVMECQGVDGNWNALETTLSETGENTYECAGKGLTPATHYTFRLRMGEHILEAGSYTTESVLQLPNRSFEEWYEAWNKKVLNGAKFWQKVTISFQQPALNATENYWSTVNDKTGKGDPNIESSYNTVPSTLKANGRTGYAACIKTVGWDNKTGNAAGTCYHVASGKLFMGTYQFEHGANVDHYDYGRTFTSRPIAIKGWYKYSPFGNDKFRMRIVVEHRDGNTIIPLGVGEWSDGIAQSGYVPFELKVIYSNLNLKATHMYVEFSSSHVDDVSGTSDCKKYADVIDDPYTHWEGSNLYIDDLELIYE